MIQSSLRDGSFRKSILRPDSTAAVSQSGGILTVQFSGPDGYAYAVQTSSNLLDWASIRTNCPINGVFGFAEPLAPGFVRRFYRSVLLP